VKTFLFAVAYFGETYFPNTKKRLKIAMEGIKYRNRQLDIKINNFRFFHTWFAIGVF